jgi:hypothetical protein
MELTTRISTEKIQREALIILFNQLNAKIAAMQPTWTAEDDQLWAALGRGNPDWSVEPIPTTNFHPGTLEGILDRPLEQFPNVCTIAYMAQPRGSSDDTGDIYAITLAVEILVKSEESEEEVNSRIQKTLEAAHLVIMDNPTLNNTVPRIGVPPRQTIGDVQGRRFERGRPALENRWYWQGGSLEYTIDKYVNFGY